jgi:(p)ppGpp synthase/HD superfamily hydrolase
MTDQKQHDRSVDQGRGRATSSTTVDRWNDAVAFVAALHGGELRKGTRIPYVTHVMAVAEVLAYRYPERDALIVAGLLHDVVEDTDATLETVRARFGAEIGALVRAVSKDDDAMVSHDGVPLPSKPRSSEAEAVLWRRRRKFMLSHIRAPEVPKDVLRLKAADAFVNLSAILRDVRNPEVGKGVWQRFKVGFDESMWFYEEIVATVGRGIGGEPLEVDLRETLAAVRAASS